MNRRGNSLQKLEPTCRTESLRSQSPLDSFQANLGVYSVDPFMPPSKPSDQFSPGNDDAPFQAKRGHAALLAIGVGSFALGTTELLPVALLTTIADDLSVSLAAVGLLVSGYALGVTLFTPILSAACSTLPRKGMLQGLMAIFFLANLLGAMAPSYSFLLAMRFLTAISHGVYLAAASTAAATLAPPGKEAHAIGIIFAGLSAAMATVVPLGSLVGQTLGWRMAFAATSVLGLVAMTAISYYVPRLPMPAHRLTLASQASLLRQPRLLLTLAITAVGCSGTFATFTYLAAFLEKITGFHPFAVMPILAGVGAAITCGNVLGGKAADLRIFPAVMGLYGLVLMGLIALWTVAPYPVAAVAVVLFLSLLMFSPGAGLQLLAVNQAKRWIPGAEDAAAGLNQSAFNLGIAMGAIIGGQVAQSSWGLRATPICSAALILLAIGLIAVGWRIDRKDEAKRQTSDDALETQTAAGDASPATSGETL